MSRVARFVGGVTLVAGVAMLALAASMNPVPDTPPDRGVFEDYELYGFEAASDKAKRGLKHIIEGRALPFPLPVWAAREVALARDQSAHARWLSEGSVPSPFYRDAVLQVTLGDAVYEEDGTMLTTKTCFQCHAGTVAGTIVAGLGNAHFDAVVAVEDIERLESWWRHPLRGAGLGLLGWVSPRSPRALTEFRDYVVRLVAPAVSHSKTRGDNLGPYSVWYLAANAVDPAKHGLVLRDPDADEGPLSSLLKVPLPSVDPLPWWNMKFKARAYWFWDAPGHRSTDFNANFWVPQQAIDRPETPDAHMARFDEKRAIIDDALQFGRETHSPPAPWDVDPAAVDMGRALYHQERALADGSKLDCLRCHGTYVSAGDGWVVDFPNAGLVDVQTDPVYNETLQSLQPLAARLGAMAGRYGDASPQSYPVTEAGYHAPVLVGLWASAPYLHNGSVPTLHALFAPATRPKIWGRVIDDPAAYDRDGVGLANEVISVSRYEELVANAAGKSADHPAAIEVRRFYDTRGLGRDAGGHTFGQQMNTEERSALIAFLVDITGEEVVPASPNPGGTR